MSSQYKGFTIVELLIVIVVIGIISAISLVAYSGTQQRSANASRLQAARDQKSIVESLSTINNGLGFTSNIRYCLSDNLKDVNNDGVRDCGATGDPTNQAVYNQAFVDRLKSVSRSLPQGSPVPGDDAVTFYGPILIYYAGWKLNGTYTPVVMEYWLKGERQACSVSKPLNFVDETATSPVGPSGSADHLLVYSPDAWSYTGDGLTYCYISINATK